MIVGREIHKMFMDSLYYRIQITDTERKEMDVKKQRGSWNWLEVHLILNIYQTC